MGVVFTREQIEKMEACRVTLKTTFDGDGHKYTCAAKDAMTGDLVHKSSSNTEQISVDECLAGLDDKADKPKPRKKASAKAKKTKEETGGSPSNPVRLMKSASED